MHTFYHRTKAYQPARNNETARSVQKSCGQSYEIRSTLQDHVAARDDAVQRMLQTHDEHINAGPADSLLSRLGYDVSRISILPSAGGAIKAKLEISSPGDEFEREADLVAEQVMRMPEPLIHDQAVAGNAEGSLCREEEEASIQAKRADGQISKSSPTMAVQKHIASSEGVPLPQSTRDSFESRFGYDFSQVRIHADFQAAEATQAINARAFTIGRDVVFAKGQFSPQTDSGRKLLAHELTHVVQQQGGSQRILDGREQLMQISAAPVGAQCTFECTPGMPIHERWTLLVRDPLEDLVVIARERIWRQAFDLAQEIAGNIFDILDCLEYFAVSTSSDFRVVRENITQQVLHPLTAATSTIYTFREGFTEPNDTSRSFSFLLARLHEARAGSHQIDGHLQQIENIFDDDPREPEVPAQQNPAQRESPAPRRGRRSSRR
jgi:hypothetical protein